MIYMFNKGFTLVELLVTIVIMGLITFMGFPSLQKMLTENKTKEFEYYGDSIIVAAKLYMQKEGRDIKEDINSFNKLKGNGLEINVEDLIDQDYLEEYKKTKKSLTCDTNNGKVKIKMDANNNSMSYDYELTCTSGTDTYKKEYDSDKFKKTS